MNCPSMNKSLGNWMVSVVQFPTSSKNQLGSNHLLHIQCYTDGLLQAWSSEKDTKLADVKFIVPNHLLKERMVYDQQATINTRYFLLYKQLEPSPRIDSNIEWKKIVAGGEKHFYWVRKIVIRPVEFPSNTSWFNLWYWMKRRRSRRGSVLKDLVKSTRSIEMLIVVKLF